MTGILKTIFKGLFASKEKPNPFIDDLRAHPNFRTKEELERSPTKTQQTLDYTLKKGESKAVTCPDFRDQKKLVLTKWYFRTGDHVKHGDILCEIQNESIMMEFESFYEGKIIWCCETNTKLSVGMEICTIEGV